MHELTVSMPAYNTGKYIREAIESVLRQDDIDFELIVVDDGSCDNTAEVVLSFNDPRVKLIRNKKNMGISYCHNLVIEISKSPFIAHVDSDDLVLPGAFQKMVDKLKSDPEIGQVHSYFFDIDEEGRITRDAFRERWKHFLESRRPDIDYKRALLVKGSIMNHLRTYRKDVFDKVGKFNKKIRIGEDYEMAIRIIDKYDIKLVPEFLYCFRIHESNTAELLRFQNLRFFIQRLIICRQLLKKGKIQFIKEKKYNLYRLMVLRLYFALELPRLDFIKSKIRNYLKERWFSIRHTLNSYSRGIYTLLIDRFSWWPIGIFNLDIEKTLPGKKRIAYYLWHYPTLSETFIQREIKALIKSGISVKVFADATDNIKSLDENTKCLLNDTCYLDPMNKKLLKKSFKYFLFKSPMSFLNLFLYIMFHRYHQNKTIKGDINIFLKAIYLAGRLNEEKINHIHSPWANIHAFISLIVSKLLRIPYTVQARAYDVHRKTYLYGLSEKFVNAELVITNTRYNESYLKSILEKKFRHKINTIYNGIDLEQFKPGPQSRNNSKPIRILTVARLVEQKGLTFLLMACKILKERGYSFRCNIVGSPAVPSFINYYIELKQLYRRLGLDDYVTFLGALPFAHILEEYREADIFVLPCVVAKDGSRDITPNVLIEAMAMKLPVISTIVTGIPEIVEDGISGILIPPNDEKNLAEEMIRLIEDHDLRKKLGECARKKVEERFDINKNVMKYINLFKGAN